MAHLLPLGWEDWDNDRRVAFCVAANKSRSRTLFWVRILFTVVPVAVTLAVSYRMFL